MRACPRGRAGRSPNAPCTVTLMPLYRFHTFLHSELHFSSKLHRLTSEEGWHQVVAAGGSTAAAPGCAPAGLGTRHQEGPAPAQTQRRRRNRLRAASRRGWRKGEGRGELGRRAAGSATATPAAAFAQGASPLALAASAAWAALTVGHFVVPPAEGIVPQEVSHQRQLGGVVGRHRRTAAVAAPVLRCAPDGSQVGVVHADDVVKLSRRSARGPVTQDALEVPAGGARCGTFQGQAAGICAQPPAVVRPPCRPPNPRRTSARSSGRSGRERLVSLTPRLLAVAVMRLSAGSPSW